MGRIMSKTLRVAALIDTAIVSGPGRQLAALALKLRTHGVDLRIFMFRRTGRASPYSEYLTTMGIDHVVLPDCGPFDLSLMSITANTLREWHPDIVQTHNYRTTVLAYLMRRAGAAWLWIAFFHGATSENLKVRFYHRIDRMLLPRADRLVVMSEQHRGMFGSARDRVHVIHNAVIPFSECKSPLSLQHLRRHGLPMVGVIGRLSSEKGIDVLLDAVASCFANGIPISVIIAGDGPERYSLQTQATTLGLAAHVHFLGTVDNLPALYSQLDLVVLPSRSEGLPNVLLEALAADVPVVATAVGAVPEVLTDCAIGELVRPQDPAALAVGIRRALACGRAPAANHARAAAAKRFSLDSRVKRHLDLYAELQRDEGDKMLGQSKQTGHR
jgi:glycosyltransferase involved in cell wall biosynthesis